jgi:hypothetical protein
MKQIIKDIYKKRQESKMSKLINLTNLNINNFIEMLRDTELIVYENIQGSKIFFHYNGSEMILKSRSISNDPINKIDLALQKYYQSAWNYLDGLDDRVKKLLPINTEFMCQYFYDNQPSHIKYDKLPKNNLMLTGIVKNGVFTSNYSELVEYAELLDIDSQPVLFKGRLTQKQLEVITYFLNTNENDLLHIFGEENFAYFFYKILNPQLHNSFLMNSGTFQENIEKLIIRVANEEEIAFAILNPLYSSNNSEKSEHVDNYTILLIEFLEYIQMVSIENVVLKSKNSDDLYIELICLIFNDYCKVRQQKIMNFNFTIPPFFYEEKFRINIDMVSNSQTKYWIESNPKLQYFFKIILSSFRQRKKKAIGIINDTTLKIFNDTVDMLQSVIDKKLKVVRDTEMGSNLLNFSDFFNITYPKDANNDVYPDLYNELGVEDELISKKKLGIKKK